jgi:hypothetical protein
MNRRGFNKLLGFLFVLFLTPFSFFGCNASNVWTDIKTWLPTGIASFEAIMMLVAPLAAPGIDAIAEMVKAAFAVLSAAVDQYIAAPAAEKQGWLAKVQLAFTDVTQNIQQFLTAVGASANPVVKLVLALATIILSTISAFLTKIGPTPAPVTLKLGSQSVTVVPVLRNRKSFVGDFNAACVDAGHPELQLH